LAVGAVLYHTLQCLNLAYPTVSEAQKQALEAARKELESEGGGPAGAVAVEAAPKAKAPKRLVKTKKRRR
jgi:hypothetical protein